MTDELATRVESIYYWTIVAGIGAMAGVCVFLATRY